ncbi:MAG: hypothetical protein WBB27_04400, partial [Maribacter sp.]
VIGRYEAISHNLQACLPEAGISRIAESYGLLSGKSLLLAGRLLHPEKGFAMTDICWFFGLFFSMLHGHFIRLSVRYRNHLR